MTQLQFNTALLGLHDKLLHYALSLTTNKDKAKDLLQETCLKALTYREKFVPNTNFKAWIYTIMKNTFINNYRRNIKTRNTFDGTNNESHLNFQKDKSYPSPESIYSSQEIVKCINALEEEYKVPFNLFLDGFKYREIADDLNLPLGTIKSRIFFTRKKLEEALKDYTY
ncbi:MAG TPA: RNA polymerase subunit sigma [Prolixibacteraceae bacterium]|jgi:RNA polymerase sigma-70 factor (ECF subfamily)|nr:RNA polymerase subunit sigma [Prolixibacteraceae bacterium]